SRSRLRSSVLRPHSCRGSFVSRPYVFHVMFRFAQWAWAPWSVVVPLPDELRSKAAAAGGQIELMWQATHDSYNSQPDNVAPLWNIKGVLNNSWHRVKYKVPGGAAASASTPAAGAAAAPAAAAPSSTAAPKN